MDSSLTITILIITIIFIISISTFIYLVRPKPKIKGINNYGLKIYYTPKDVTYHYVTVDYGRGDRCFYTETEAMENGFNKASK
tara:strand:- start:477 stop:725 length:249 start_codon:yes stop_codon:yes gene_type:complete